MVTPGTAFAYEPVVPEVARDTGAATVVVVVGAAVAVVVEPAVTLSADDAVPLKMRQPSA
jgi:hypothetical protein